MQKSAPHRYSRKRFKFANVQICKLNWQHVPQVFEAQGLRRAEGFEGRDEEREDERDGADQSRVACLLLASLSSGYSFRSVAEVGIRSEKNLETPPRNTNTKCANAERGVV